MLHDLYGNLPSNLCHLLDVIGKPLLNSLLCHLSFDPGLHHSVYLFGLALHFTLIHALPEAVAHNCARFKRVQPLILLHLDFIGLTILLLFGFALRQLVKELRPLQPDGRRKWVLSMISRGLGLKRTILLFVHHPFGYAMLNRLSRLDRIQMMV